ncbi:hypothetical protein BDF14DRAFT_229887 [Spinellus fusiger]|nr:hypothetical protein BDF14DRAFT_229887 [Spinellus fusiger]
MHTISFQPIHYTTSTKNTTEFNSRSLLLSTVNTTHDLYSMECGDRPNTLARVLVGLHEMGASQERLRDAYLTVCSGLERLSSCSTSRIEPDTWQDFLGNKNYYRDYLFFFDQYISHYGLESTLHTYLYSSHLYNSIGSQLQPLVHIVFGLEQNLPKVVAQGLAYLASTYWDPSNILSCSVPQTAPLNPHLLLADLVKSDQRFDGKIESSTFGGAIKLLLKSKSALLQTYMAEWSRQTGTWEDRLKALIELAVEFIPNSARPTTHTMELDWFLAGGQLLSSALAIQSLASLFSTKASSQTEKEQQGKVLEHLVQLQFLLSLCTFVVQGRPWHPHSSTVTDVFSWKECMDRVVASDDTKAILALNSLIKARTQTKSQEMHLHAANLLVACVEQQGTWIKGGTGWHHR